MRVLHVLNYGWPYIDGYTVRSMGLIAAQKQHLGLDVQIAVSPFPPFEKATDRTFRTDAWGPDEQHAAGPPGPWTQAFERPAVGLAPRTASIFRRALRRLVRRFQPDLIHAHHPHYVGRAALRVARQCSLPFVYEVRCFNGDYDLSRRHPRYRLPYYRLRGHHRNRLEHRLCERADAVATISDGMAHRLVAGGLPKKHVFVVRNSVDMKHFSATDGVSGYPREGPLHMGYATSFSKIENLDLLVRNAAALQDALRAHFGRRFRLTIAGDGDDRPRIERLAQTQGVTDIVQLPGFIPYGRMPDFYRSLDLFVVPRGRVAVTQDTPPLKPLEALASGVPVLATDLPALRELLGKRPGTRFFQPTAAHLARALLRFAEHPWKPGSNALKKRSWKHEVRRYETVYDSAFDRAARHASAA